MAAGDQIIEVPGIGQVAFPAGMNDAQISSAIKSNLDMQRMADPTSGMSGVEKAIAGYGKAVPDLARGIGQIFGLVSREEVAEARQRDAPLMRSGAGMAGNIAGNLAALLPAAAIPGAATIPGAAAIGSGIGAIQPSVSSAETLTNIGLGGTIGAGGQKVAGLLSRNVVGLPKTPATESLQSARQAGYVIPPSQQPGAGLFSRVAEGFAGKLTTAQSASAKNQAVTNQLARQALGLSDDVALNPTTLNAIRKQAGQAYEAVKQVGVLQADDAFTKQLNGIAAKYAGAESQFPGLGKTPVTEIVEVLKQKQFTADGAIDAISILRDKADVAFRGGDKGLGRAFREASDALEGVIERNLSANPATSGLLEGFRNARQTIAKTYTVEKALNPATENISAQMLGQELRRGRPLSGGLRQAGETGLAFPKAVQRPEVIGSQPGISPLDVVGSGIFGGAGAALGGPAGAMAAAIPFLRPAVRAGILSRPYQAMIARPGLLGSVPGVQGNQALIEDILRRSAVPLAGLPLTVQR